MIMTKQEKIQEAYGCDVDGLVDVDGWSIYGVDEGSEYGVEPYGDYETRNHYDGKYEWRPKSLKGIEYNNGWIKINSESDLPEQGGEYIVFRMSKKSTATYCKSDRWMVPENDYPKTTFKHGITHYRKKEIIPNPVY